MKKQLILLLLLLLVAPVWADDIAVVGTLWKQKNTTVLPADDITVIDMSGVTAVFGATTGISNSESAVYVRTTFAQFTTYGSTSSIVPLDNTPPLITEGARGMFYNYSADDASNTITVQANALHASATGFVTGSLFTFGNSTSVASVSQVMQANDHTRVITLFYSFLAGTTDPISLEYRYGHNAGAVAQINGRVGAGLYAGARNTVFLIKETTK